MLGMMPTMGSTHDPESLKTGLISLWELNDASGVLVDSHGSNNLLALSALNGGTYQAKGMDVDGAIDLDGTNDYTRYSVSDNRFTPGAAHSVNTWVNRTGDSVADSYGSLVSKSYSSTGFRIYLLSMLDTDFSARENEILTWYYDTNNVQQKISYNVGGSDLWTGNWTMLTTTRSGGTFKLYVNGDEVATHTGGTGTGQSTASTNVHWCLGAQWKSSTQPDIFFNGHMGQTGTWSKQLTEAEVKFLYNQGSGIKYDAWT